MNILFLCQYFYPHVGGVEKHVLEISRYLQQKGYSITIICEKHDSKLPQKEEFDGITIHRIPNYKYSFSKKFKIWKWFILHRKLIVRSDIIHCHDVFIWYLPFRFLLPFKKVYTTFHGYESYPLPFKNILIHKLSEILSSGNICIGEFIKKWYRTKPDYISYGGVNIPNLKLNNLKPKTRSSVFVGRLDEQTGITVYCDAVKKIREKFPDFEFAVIGDGKFRNIVKKTGDFLGIKKDPETYFEKYNFAFVSRYLAILEAMAAKRLVFALYDNPIKKDYLTLSPFERLMVIAKNAEELAVKIDWYLKNPKEETKKVNKAFQFAKKQSWSTLSNLYIHLWKE